MTPRVRRWTVIGLVAVAVLGAAAAFRLRNAVGLIEVWRTETGTELCSEPGGDVLDEYVFMPLMDSSGKRIDFVARRGSFLRYLPVWPVQSAGAPFHLLEETGAAADADGKRWLCFRVIEEGLTPDQVVKSIRTR